MLIFVIHNFLSYKIYDIDQIIYIINFPVISVMTLYIISIICFHDAFSTYLRNDTIIISIICSSQAEDEDGYRQLIDEKKNQRLHYLLTQTDEYITGLMQLVTKHKKDLDLKKKPRRSRRKVCSIFVHHMLILQVF